MIKTLVILTLAFCANIGFADNAFKREAKENRRQAIRQQVKQVEKQRAQDTLNRRYTDAKNKASYANKLKKSE